MKESVLRFGARGELIGILSVPDKPAPGARPVLLPNTGLEHRVGPNRLHVHLCRALSEAGFPTLRLDLAGMGDSGAPDASGADPTSNLKSAMDALEARGMGPQFMVVGLCSGAHDAHMLIRADQRVVGGAFIDGYVYPTVRYFLTYFIQRALDPVRVIRRMFRAARISDSADQAHSSKGELDYFRQPPLAEMRRDLANFVNRGLSLSYIYTGQIQYKYNYADQLKDALPELRGYARAEVNYMAMADHTFSRTSMRSELVGVVLRWAIDCAGTQATSASTPARSG